MLETTMEDPDLETELDTTTRDALDTSTLLHPGPPVPGDLTHADPRTSSSRAQTSSEAAAGQGPGPEAGHAPEAEGEDEPDWGAGLEQLNLPSSSQARIALDRVLSRTPRQSTGQPDDQEAERERDRLAEEELTRLLAVDPNDWTTMSAALSRRLSAHAPREPDASRVSGKKASPTAQLSRDDEEAGELRTPARSDTADETQFARRALPQRTSLGAALAGEPDEADLYGLGDQSNMAPLDDGPEPWPEEVTEAGDPGLPFLSRDDLSLARDASRTAVSGDGTGLGMEEAPSASATRLLDVTNPPMGEREQDQEQEGEQEEEQEEEMEREVRDENVDQAEPEAELDARSPPLPEPEWGVEQVARAAGRGDMEAAEPEAESDEGSWASDDSAGGVLRQRLNRRRGGTARSARNRDRVPASLVTRLFTAVAGRNYRLDSAALTAAQDASDAFFGALARDVSAAARARTRRPQGSSRAATVTETDLLAALVAHGHVNARNDVYTTALTLLPRELSDWIDVARVEPQRSTLRRATQAARATNEAATAAVRQSDPDPDETAGAVRAPGMGRAAHPVPPPPPPPARSRAARKQTSDRTATGRRALGKHPATSAPASTSAGPKKRPRSVPSNPLAKKPGQTRNQGKATGGRR